jgi:hypothetical protein
MFHVGPLAPDAAARLKEYATTTLTVAPPSVASIQEIPSPRRQGDNDDEDDDGNGIDGEGHVKNPSSLTLVGAASQVLASLGGGEVEDFDALPVFRNLQDSLGQTTGSDNMYGQVLLMASVMATSLQEPVPVDMERSRSYVDDVCKIAAVDPNFWLFRDYMEAFDEIPGLKELIATPLMVEIAT